MKRDTIIKMPAGRKMDELIAKKYFGYETYTDQLGVHHELIGEFVHVMPHYSERLSAAMTVFTSNKHSEVYLEKSNDEWFCMIDNDMKNCATAETPQLAICRAALIKVMEAR